MFESPHPTACTWSATRHGRGKRAVTTALGYYVIEHIATGKCVVATAKQVSDDVDRQLQKLLAGKHDNRALNILVAMDMDLKLYEYACPSLAMAKDGVRAVKNSLTPTYLLLNP